MPQPLDYSLRYTPEDYFALDAASDIRLEYHNGRITPHLDDYIRQTPGPEDRAVKLHNRVLNNVWFALESELRRTDSPREVFTHNISTEMRAALGAMYPDIVMTTTAPDHDLLSVVFPALIVEVLSPATEKNDRGWKFDAYRTLATVDQIVLIDPRAGAVDSYLRNRDGVTWTLVALRDSEEALNIPTLDLNIPLTEVFRRIEPNV